MTWSDVEVTASEIETEQAFEPIAESPFSRERKRRITVMSLVIGGGAVIIVGMRFFVGGPATATAQIEAQRTIESYLLPSDSHSNTDTTSNAIATLSHSDQFRAGHAVRAVHMNPFILPGTLQAVVAETSGHRGPSRQLVREEELQSLVSEMHVSMVLRGRTTMAIIDGHTVRLNEAVELPDNVNLTLMAVNSSGIHVQLADPSMDVTHEAILPKP